MSETNPSGLSENGIAALSYITFIPAILFLILPRYNRSAYVRFHAWQSLLLNVVVFLLSFIVTYLLIALHAPCGKHPPVHRPGDLGHMAGHMGCVGYRRIERKEVEAPGSRHTCR